MKELVMQRISTDASSILVSDAVAVAVVRYATALATKRRIDVASVPTVDEYGQRIFVDILLGPGVSVLSEPAEDDELEGEGDEWLVDIAARHIVLQALPTGT